MVTSLLLGLLAHASSPFLPLVAGNMVWEEPPSVQKMPGYHPMLRFQPTSEYAYGKNTNQTFLFVTPDYPAEGHYQVTDNHYVFRPDTAIQLGNADVDKLVADMDPETKTNIHKGYARSLTVFDADYDPSDNAIRVNYPVKGMMKTFTLYAYTEGDQQSSGSLSDSDRSMIGLWNAPEPFPEKLDARTRYKIGGLEGLQQFSKEATASDGAQFGLLDLRPDMTFRITSTVGTWHRDGSTLILRSGDKVMTFTISSNGTKLLAGNKPAYVRGQ